MNNNKTTTTTSYLTTNTFILVIGILCIVLAAVYFYNQYKAVQKKIKANERKEHLPNDCPDYWIINNQQHNKKGELTSIKCNNKHKLGICALNPNENSFTFGDEIFTNPNTKDLARCKWAKQCQVAWTGYDHLCVA